VKDYTYQKNNYEGTIFNDGTAILRKKEVKWDWKSHFLLS
jgi:hypothetical protein